MKTLTGLTVLLGGTLLMTVSAQNLPKITRVGEVNLTVTSMVIPGMALSGLGSHDMVMGSGMFYKGAGEPATAPAVDQCFVTVQTDHQGVGMPSKIPGMDTQPKAPAYLDAGDPLSLRQGGRPYTTLPRKKSGQMIQYATAMPNTLKPPTTGLTLDIPGAAGGFPSMKNKAFPVASLVQLTTPKAAEDITPGTLFSWSHPSNDPGTQVMLMMRQDDKKLSVLCLAVDDGKFNFPAATVTELKAKGFGKGKLSTLGRISRRHYQEGDAQLNLTAMTMQAVMDTGDDESTEPDDGGN